MDFRDWLKEDYYSFLKITQFASAEEINRAYRKKAKSIHPDAFPIGSPEREQAEQRFRYLQLVKETLLDPYKRQKYDEERLIQQQCFLNTMRYDFPVTPKPKEKPSFKKVLDNVSKRIDFNEYDYDPERNIYRDAKDKVDEDMLTQQEKSQLYKERGARRYFEEGMKAVRYGDYNRAWVCFNSARYLDKNIKVPPMLWHLISKSRHKA